MVDRHISLRRALAAGTLALLALSLTGCKTEAPPPPPPPPEGTPRLILFLVVDQARYDYLERFRPLLSSGLARLLDEAVVFTNAHHDHAFTSTAPGHATLATGVHPARHGIINNWWLDRATARPTLAVGDPPSPKLLLAPALGDWLKAAYPSARIFAAAGKDRAAILTAGQKPDGAFWSSSKYGLFTTSKHYLDKEPEWLRAYHRNHFPDRYFGQAWEPLPEVVEHMEALGLQTIDRGIVDRQFPHAIGSASPAPGIGYYRDFLNATPFGDAYLADFARALIESEQLGQDAVPDFLGLGFSAMDKIGHSFGPDSPEILDTLLRLDRVLGELLDYVDEHVGLEHTIVSLSGDHGVAPVPEVLQARGVEARRYGTEDILCFQQARGQLREKLGREWLLGSYYFDRQAAAASGVDLEMLEDEGRRLLEQCPGVVRVWTASELGKDASPAADPDLEKMRRLYAHSFHPERSPDLLVQLEPNHLPYQTTVANHGSPYPYDSHVPWLLRLPSGTGARVVDPVFTVDVAPTVARLAGLTPPAGLDGVDRTTLLPSAPEKLNAP